MATRGENSALRQIRTLFRLGKVGERTDGELLEWFESHRAEAEAAFEELVVRHGAMVLDVCRRVLRDPNDADDAFQATFLILARRAGSIRDRDALGGWLHRVALRVALAARADAARRRDVELRANPAAIVAASIHENEREEIRRALHEELERIPANYRAAVVACHLEGLSHEEAATRLRWPVGTVRSRLARGRDRLRDRLTRRGFAPGVVAPALASRPDAVPAVLLSSVTMSMCAYVSGHLGGGTVPATAAALSEQVIQAMHIRTLKIVAAVVVAIGIFGGTLPLVPRLIQAAHAGQTAPGTLAGVVKDADGKPVAGATVVAGVFTSKPNHQVTTTDSDGRFAFPSKEGERKIGYVLAYKEGLAPASKFSDLEKKLTPEEILELELLKPEAFVGIVHDRSLKPIAGAKVAIQYMRGPGGKYDHNPILENVVGGTPLEPLFVATTDEEGKFRFPAVPPPYRVVLKATADGMAEYTSEIPGDYEAGYITGTVDRPAHLTMEPGARIEGRVSSKVTGLDVAGLDVALQSTNDSPQFWRTAKLGADGRFGFDGLPEGGGNIFLIDHPNDGPWTYRAIDNLALHPGKTAGASIELIEGAMVTGKVVDAGSGEPVPGLFIGMHGPARPASGAAILSTKTDAKGEYRFRLPPGKSYFYTAGAPPWSYGEQKVEVPDDVKAITVPDMKLTKKPPAEPAKAAAKPAEPPREMVDFAGIVRDVSDTPIGGSTVVVAVMEGDAQVDRHVLTTGADGRFRVTIVRPAKKDSAPRFLIYAFHETFAPCGTFATRSDTDLTLVLPRARPFACVVQDRGENPIAGADAWVESIDAPVPEGQGTIVTKFSRVALEGTPIEDALHAQSNGDGLLRFPSIPARSRVNMTVASPGKRTHHTTDFGRPNMTGRWPAGYDAGFLTGNSDWPATIYLDPEAADLQGILEENGAAVELP